MKKVLFPILAVVLALSLALPMAAVVGASPDTMTVVSDDLTTKTAGYTTTDPVSDPLTSSNYSVPGWKDAVDLSSPHTNWYTENTSPFVGAYWVSSIDGSEGIAGEDQWRLFKEDFTIPSGAVNISGSLYMTADNAVEAYLNGTSAGSTGYVYGAAPADPKPHYFASAHGPYTLAPVVGSNTLTFVVRNWSGTGANPTGLLYKAVIEYDIASITLTKSAEWPGDRAGLGETIDYTFTVTNTGDVAFAEDAVSVTDSNVDDPPGITGPVEVSGNGDAFFDPGEVWEFSGTHEVTEGDLASCMLENTATAYADYGEITVEATDTEYVPVAKMVNLWAGKDTDVGYVEIWNDGDCVHVIYQIDDGMPWEITEVHLYVGSNEPPTNAPGQFPYDIGDADSVTETTVEFCIALEDIDSYSMKVNKKGKTVGPMTADGNPGKIGEEPIVPGDTIYVAAHSVVMDISCYQTGILYGIERYTGKVYEVDVLSGASSLEFTITPPPALGSAKPNGLAYDPAGDGRWYFCDYQPTTTLYFWDGISQQVAGDLTVDDVGAPVGDIADADFYDGKYYFVTGPPSSDLLYEVTFDANGLMTGPPVFIASISGGTHDYTFNGDIAIKDGVIYGWGKCGTHNKYEFFSVNIDGTGFAYVTPTYQTSLQLAFGSDGTLYGHRSGGTGEFFEVGTGIADFGDVTSIGWNVQGQLYTDCASGEICIPTTETAWGGWGDGILNRVEFPDKNWSNYLWFDLMDCDD